MRALARVRARARVCEACFKSASFFVYFGLIRAEELLSSGGDFGYICSRLLNLFPNSRHSFSFFLHFVVVVMRWNCACAKEQKTAIDVQVS